ncbi:MAG: hypothetical protein IKE73_03320 [Bacilli bacterium]|nr:hypothetical protein [Bacilli bacterium]
MKKIETSLINKYINGDDIEGYTLEELENDSSFMKAVIHFTNDPKMYSLCSDNLKKDYDFVRFLINKFESNSTFIMEVANYFLSNTDNDIQKKELSIMMEDKLPEKLSFNYRIANQASYLETRVEIEALEIQKPSTEASLGMGFIYVFDLYNDSSIIVNDYAKRMINEIIEDNLSDFNTALHKIFEGPEQLQKMGVNNFLIDEIGNHDQMLSSYVSVHPELIEKYKEKIDNILENWDKYEAQAEEKRYDNMFAMVHEYLSMVDTNMTEQSVLYYAANELGIRGKLQYYDEKEELKFIDEDYEIEGFKLSDYIMLVNDEEIKEEIEWSINTSLKERSIYLNVKKIMINQIFYSKPTDVYSLISATKQNAKKGKSDCQIIKLLPKKETEKKED